jgi:hypothetical protein
MSHSRFLLLISLAGCGDDGPACGVDGAPADGLVASASALTIKYTGLTAGPNHDCPAADAPAGVESLTLMGAQEGGGSGLFTACVPRPDLLAADQAIGLAMNAAFSLVDLSGSDANGCVYAVDRTVPPTGTAKAEGLCDAGTNKAGFALDVMGMVSMKASATQPASCTAPIATSFAVTIAGRVAVTPM